MLDDIYASLDFINEYEMRIIGDSLKRINSLQGVWQIRGQLEQAQGYMTQELGTLGRRLEVADANIMNEAAYRTIATDNRIYKAAGKNIEKMPEVLKPRILSSTYQINALVQEILRSTWAAASIQFEYVAMEYINSVATGALTPQEAIKKAVRSFSDNGLEAIRYPTGRRDYLDVALRRAIMSGVSEQAGGIQLELMEYMEAGYVETTAHSGARPTHAVWQGRVFKRVGSEPEYPNFYQATGYGDKLGLCGINCRHSFFPFFPELSRRAYDESTLREYNTKQVKYNGEEMDVYEASQKQRYIERNIRKWKREASGLDDVGQDSAFARGKVREWQATQRDFISQTGLTRDYFREQVY